LEAAVSVINGQKHQIVFDLIRKMKDLVEIENATDQEVALGSDKKETEREIFTAIGQIFARDTEVAKFVSRDTEIKTTERRKRILNVRMGVLVKIYDLMRDTSKSKNQLEIEANGILKKYHRVLLHILNAVGIPDVSILEQEYTGIYTNSKKDTDANFANVKKELLDPFLKIGIQ
jgi:hypothetical protein